MGPDFSKTSHVLFFAAFLPGLSFGLGYLAFALLPDVPFWLETLSPLAAYGLIYGLFDKYLWKWPVFKWLGIVRVDDMSGRWYGEQTSSFKRPNGKPAKSRIILEVKQTFSSVSACSYYKNWRSPNCRSTIMNIDGNNCLVLIFESEPNSNHSSGDSQHKGVTQLSYFKQDDKICGTYFSSNGTNGDIVLNRSTKPIIGRFE